MKIKRIFLSVLGLMLLGIGVGFALISKLGVDPNSVFVTGLANQLNITYGISSFIINGTILTIVYIIDKSYVNISSILGMFLVGFTVDGFLMIYNLLYIIPISNIVIRLIFLFLGIIILSTGIVTYINQNLGIAAFDSISEIISRKRKIDYKYVRMTIDTTMMILGWLLGGSIGLGTVVIALLTGPTVKLVRRIMKVE